MKLCDPVPRWTNSTGSSSICDTRNCPVGGSGCRADELDEAGGMPELLLLLLAEGAPEELDKVVGSGAAELLPMLLFGAGGGDESELDMLGNVAELLEDGAGAALEEDAGAELDVWSLGWGGTFG